MATKRNRWHKKQLRKSRIIWAIYESSKENDHGRYLELAAYARGQQLTNNHTT